MSNRTINIGLCGFGVVGQGVYDHLNSKRQALRELLGADMFVTRIAVRDLSKKRDVEIDESSVSNDPIAIATDPSIDIVCELMGGTEIAREVT